MGAPTRFFVWGMQCQGKKAVAAVAGSDRFRQKSPSQKAVGAGLSGMDEKPTDDHPTPVTTPTASAHSLAAIQFNELHHIPRGKLGRYVFDQSSGAKLPQIVIEISSDRNQFAHIDLTQIAPIAQDFHRVLARSVVVPSDIEAPEPRRKPKCGKVIGRQGGDHRHLGQDRSQGQHGFEAFADDEYVVNDTEPYAVAEKIAHGLSRRRQLRYDGQSRIQPSAVHASDRPGEVCDGRQQSG